MKECRDCKYIDALLTTCKAPDMAHVVVKQHLHVLHEWMDLFRIASGRELEVLCEGAPRE